MRISSYNFKAAILVKDKNVTNAIIPADAGISIFTVS